MKEKRPNILLDSLRETLINISQNSYQHVQNPEECSRRASVALIIRIRPFFDEWPSNTNLETECDKSFDLNRFFSTSWVQQGDPEICFIRRAAREGDRWTSHVAFPGGKKDSNDIDDVGVAIRETAEEIGLDLTSSDAIHVGYLPERLILTVLEAIPIMILCPFVFLWTRPVLPPLRLQPGEVASIHWVSLRTLMSPYSQTYKYVNTSDRLMQRGSLLSKFVLRFLLGLMEFPAIKLSPSESLYCTTTEEFFPTKQPEQFEPRRLFLGKFFGHYFSKKWNKLVTDEPLLLWGLTLGILIDFFNQLPSHNPIELWSYPTFTNYDVRLTISLLTMSTRRRIKKFLQEKNVENPATIDHETKTVPMQNSFNEELNDPDKTFLTTKNRKMSYPINGMLDSYHIKLRQGAIIAITLRIIGTVSLMSIILKKYIKK